MADKYYYLVASLPYLKKEEKPVQEEFFLSECGKWLSEKDLAVLYASDMREESEKTFNVPAFADWQIFISRINDELVAARESGLTGSQPDASFSTEVKTVFEEENPLLMEQKLASIKLDFIDGELNKYFFDINWLILYYLKLQIIERLHKFNKDIGEKFFYELCEVEYEK